MYDIKNLNIWKVSSRNVFDCKYKVIEAQASKNMEDIMDEKCKKIFEEIMTLVPTADIAGIKERRGGKLRFPIYVNERLMTTDLDVLELSVRSSNCLHRAGYRTIGELIESIESSEDLRKIRNCGTKSVDEIMEKLFCYQYSQFDVGNKVRYINKVLQLN